MKQLHKVIEILSKHKGGLKDKYKIQTIKIFGSYARNKQNVSSDIDLIVSFEETPTLIELVKIQEELEALLGIKVDLLTEENISPFINPYIKEVVTI